MALTIQIEIGALARPLHTQVNEQVPKAFKVSKKEMKHCQRDADALVRLRIRAILTSSELERANYRLRRTVTTEITQQHNRREREKEKRQRKKTTP